MLGFASGQMVLGLPEAPFLYKHSDSMEVSELIALYNKAWSEPDYALRQKLLEQIWAEDGTYTDPTAHAGRRSSSITSGHSLCSSLEPTLW